MRPVEIIHDIQPQAGASLMIKMGGTHVICAVSVENTVPPFLRDSGQGWITAEYGMLPTSTNTRMKREAGRGRSGRTYEIQRLIGRSLRMMVDLHSLDGKTFRVDCDVINADGGTRTASITGAALALRQAIKREFEQGNLAAMPDILPIAAISAGLVNGQALLDLEYSEDSRADVDANFVMTADGRWIEAQSTAEGRPFSPEDFTAIAGLARKGINELLALWECA
ncbi:MAG: ribonuclease PH [Deltaproteobacteria bacterium]|nr:ribonuclease PH [Deltaproteobacteria bacterium]